MKNSDMILIGASVGLFGYLGWMMWGNDKPAADSASASSASAKTIV